MKIFDIHIHANNTKATPDLLLNSMEKTGIFGGCIFSNWPDRSDTIRGTSFDERLSEVLAWTKGYEDRLFPVIWIHPYEENIIENIRKAVENGICGFKIICDDFYVYEEKCLEVLREIASLDKPVFFHSGILWDGKESSKYNRPVHWEALVNIEGLRFSMGHCSWPWIDECIALYGQFLNASTVRRPAEMFFDLTPGTPEIYRKELLEKLYTVGYDIGNNVMFGTDSSADTYSPVWPGKWLDIDTKILEKLGVSKANMENLYYNNLMRFLGKGDAVEHIAPVPDDAGNWTAVNTEVPKVIEKWYRKLDFPKIYDAEFYRALREIKISDAISIEKYDIASQDGKRNLLSMLFLCEHLSEQYREKGISETILQATLSDLVIWTNIWSEIKGELYLGELHWLKSHLGMHLFRLGRLQFCMGKAEHDIPVKGVRAGGNVLEVHIPEGEPLSKESCLQSIEVAKKFFEKYFPEFDYKCITCHSWLLDSSLERFLNQGSNILQFGRMFEAVHSEKSDAILRYLFRWDTTRYNVKFAVPYNGFMEAVKRHVLKGGELYEVLGVLR